MSGLRAFPCSAIRHSKAINLLYLFIGCVWTTLKCCLVKIRQEECENLVSCLISLQIAIFIEQHNRWSLFCSTWRKSMQKSCWADTAELVEHMSVHSHTHILAHANAPTCHSWGAEEVPYFLSKVLLRASWECTLLVWSQTHLDKQRRMYFVA